MKLIIPSTSVSPEAMRNSIRPSCTPLSNWTTMSERLIGSDGAVTSLRLWHLAVVHVNIRIVALHGPTRHLDQLAFVRLYDLEQDIILDGKVVGIELEFAAHGSEARFLDRGNQGGFVRYVALYLKQRGVKQLRGIVGVGRDEGGTVVV